METRYKTRADVVSAAEDEGWSYFVLSYASAEDMPDEDMKATFRAAETALDDFQKLARSPDPEEHYDPQRRVMTKCQADDDDDCAWAGCPQTRDNEPFASGRHCPLDDCAFEVTDQVEEGMGEKLDDAALFTTKVDPEEAGRLLRQVTHGAPEPEMEHQTSDDELIASGVLMEEAGRHLKTAARSEHEIIKSRVINLGIEALRDAIRCLEGKL